jgi:Ferredoxin subunits of nitrite reductase and ring-hydroxylating dioxygenases
MTWRKTITAKSLRAAGASSVRVGDEVIYIAAVGDKLYAINGVCSHAKCILGILETDSLRTKCQCHHAEFNLTDGKMVVPPYVAPNILMDKLTLKVYPVREEKGFIEVDT